MPVFNMSNQAKIKYLEILIGKVFKILPLYEEDCNKMFVYLGGLIIDIYSANSMFNDELIEILVKLNRIEKSIEHKSLRKIVFETTNIINTKRKELIDSDNTESKETN